MVSNTLKGFFNKLAFNKPVSIAGRNVLVTGGTSGIGKLVAEECARRGANAVIVWDIARLDETVAHLKNMNTQSKGYKVNVADVDNVNEAAKQVLADFGHVDILVESAGVVSGKSFLELTDEQIDRTLEINLRGLFSTTRAFLPSMIERDEGFICAISSVAGAIGPANLSDYCASKWGARGMMESLRNELKKSGSKVRTLTVMPFYIDTGLFAGAKSKFEWLFPILHQEDVADEIIKAITNGEAELFIPRKMNYATNMLRGLPIRWFDALSTFLGVNESMDDFTGRKSKN